MAASGGDAKLFARVGGSQNDQERVALFRSFC